MNLRIIPPLFAILAFTVCQLGAAEPETAVFPSVADMQAGGKDKDQPQPPDKKKTPDQKSVTPPDTDQFTRTPTPISDALGFSPHMLGDFGVLFARQSVTVPGTQTTTTTTTKRVIGADGVAILVRTT